ncbi:MAG: SPOR domain-containing protein [Rhodobacteraceae bacterium]|jgi:cell division septation protein DedD|uniref:SPOR domain-containing protein n=1 Tax=Albidovulum sp. TaxID=1872424 RepID=UPI001D6D4D0E|nr:SPOR domain-containing protein [uncultured Defluviimonas sp.]MCB2126862.1 SPOR domain-containing protein [Paracoccaceae bacterium]MCC0071106.1 SPOR domain-containing protein [Paracoccaceae bacterium]
MTLRARARFGLACATALTLAGCVAGTGPRKEAADAAPAGAGFSPVSVARDVEAPQVFNVTGQGLWDGRPSLGGVWVAHSSVKDPERVIIRNVKNGKSVVGALFRRERDLPGPGLQISSDAAEALGLLAGQPAEVTVVALRREEEPVPVDAEIGPDETAVAAVQADAAGEVADAPETPVASDSPATAEAAASASPDADGEAAAATDAGAAATPAPKKSGGLFGFLKKKPKPMAPDAEAVAAGAGTGAIEQTTLDPVAATASAALDRVEAQTAPQAVAAAPAAIKRGYIQIGIFSTEANANRASEQMKGAGMTATVRTDQSAGKTYWRVIVGPAATVAERDALVARVKGIGYPDAYPVSN